MLSCNSRAAQLSKEKQEGSSSRTYVFTPTAPYSQLPNNRIWAWGKYDVLEV
jgi:hypothetical protein